MTDAVPGDPHIHVRHVVPVAETPFGKELFHPGAREVDQRPDDPPLARPHPAQAARAGPPQKPQDDGFRLVVTRVPEGDLRRACLVGHFAERGMAQDVCRALDGPAAATRFGGHVNAPREEGLAASGRLVAAPLQVAVGVGAPDAVVHVRHASHGGAEPGEDLGQRLQQRHRVGTA